jgi:ubiquinol-cytochrome c reductase iron-sulfur subunit
MVESLNQLEARLRDPQSEGDPAYIEAASRSVRPEFLVVEGVCTHAACVPRMREEDGKAIVGDWWVGGFICPCHGSAYDFAGRVVRGPAPTNLAIPPHRFVSPTRLIVGEEPTSAT